MTGICHCHWPIKGPRGGGASVLVEVALEEIEGGCIMVDGVYVPLCFTDAAPT